MLKILNFWMFSHLTWHVFSSVADFLGLVLVEVEPANTILVKKINWEVQSRGNAPAAIEKWLQSVPSKLGSFLCFRIEVFWTGMTPTPMVSDFVFFFPNSKTCNGVWCDDGWRSSEEFRGRERMMFRGLRDRWLMRFRRVAVQIVSKVPEGSGADGWWGSEGLRCR